MTKFKQGEVIEFVEVHRRSYLSINTTRVVSRVGMGSVFSVPRIPRIGPLRGHLFIILDAIPREEAWDEKSLKEESGSCCNCYLCYDVVNDKEIVFYEDEIGVL